MPACFSFASTPRLKSGASIPTNTSGCQSNISRIKPWRILRISGNRRITSAKPRTASFSCSYKLLKPNANIRGPPMPTNCTSGRRAFKAFIKWAPSKSPDASPAHMAMVRGRLRLLESVINKVPALRIVLFYRKHSGLGSYYANGMV